MRNIFNIRGQSSEEPTVNTPQHHGTAIQELLGETTVEQIEGLVKNNRVILFMKGNPVFPQCGFSAQSVAILDSYEKPFNTFDILSNQEIRQGLKEYANWPTYPQLWIEGNLVGGSDIMAELYQSGELKTMVG